MDVRSVFGTFSAAAVLTVVLFAAPACASPRGRVYVRIGPPAPVVERAVVAPGPGYVWLPGYYRWDGRAYVWVPGRHVLPPRPRAVWVPGHWAQERRGWFWVEGRWR
jgi:WXXGXW repeat (2 copies)